MEADQTRTSCTLDVSGRLARLAEFDEFFAASVTGTQRAGPTRLRLELRPDRQAGQQAGALAAAETACCSFFSFALTATAGRLVLDVTVTPPNQDALDRMAARVHAAAPA
jgi:hypothetical protein